MKIIATLAFASLQISALAAEKYLDINGVTTGFGVSADGTYNWADNLWTISSAGTSSSGSWGNDNSAFLGVGGSYTLESGSTRRELKELRVTAGTPTITGPSSVLGDLFFSANGSNMIDIAAGSTLTISAKIASVVPITFPVPTNPNLAKRGLGTLVLSGVNSFVIPVSVQEGTLRLGGASALLTTQNVTVDSGATFDLNGFNQTLESLNAVGNIALGSGNLTFGLTGSRRSTISGSISGTGGIKVDSPGGLDLTGNNTFTGPINVNQSELVIGGGTSGAITASSITVASNLRVVFNRSDAQSYSGVVNGAGGLFQSGGPLTLVGTGLDINVRNVASGLTITLPMPSPSGTAKVFNKTISGSGPVHFNLNSNFNSFKPTLPLTYTGATKVSGGAFRVTDSNILPAATDLTLDRDGSYDLTGSQTLNSLATTNGKDGALFLRGSNNTLNVNSANAATNPIYTFESPLIVDSATSSVTFSRTGTGTVTHRFTSSTGNDGNPFGNSGIANINLGTVVELTNHRGSINLAQGAGLKLLSNNFSAATLNTHNTLTSGNVTFSNLIFSDLNPGPNTLASSYSIKAINNLGAINLTTESSGKAANLAVSEGLYEGYFSGLGSLTKNGNGLLRLTGEQHDYTGGTFIRGGVFELTGRLNNSNGNVIISNNAVLTGTGRIIGPVTVEETIVIGQSVTRGIVNPGTVGGIGTFSVGGFKGSSNSLPSNEYGILEIDVDGTTSDTLRINSSGANASLGIVDLSKVFLNVRGTLNDGQTVVIIDNDNSDAVVGSFIRRFGGNAQALTEGALIAVGTSGKYARISYLGNTSGNTPGNDVTLTGVSAAELSPRIESFSIKPIGGSGSNANNLRVKVVYQSVENQFVELQMSTDLMVWDKVGITYGTAVTGKVTITQDLPVTFANTPKLFIRIAPPSGNLD